MCKLVIKGCPYLTTAYYAPGDVVENQCGLTEYELCADRDECLLKKLARGLREGNTQDCLSLLKPEKALVSFKS